MQAKASVRTQTALCSKAIGSTIKNMDLEFTKTAMVCVVVVVCWCVLEYVRVDFCFVLTVCF